MKRNWGLVYQGGKGHIAECIIDALPYTGGRFVDLFAGGLSVTHAASYSGKFSQIVCNDIVGTPFIFDFVKSAEWPLFWRKFVSRDEFFETRNKAKKTPSDIASLAVWSFGAVLRSYLYGKVIEQQKKDWHEFLFTNYDFKTVGEYQLQFLKLRGKWPRTGSPTQKENEQWRKSLPQHLEHLRRMERLQHLERMERLQRMERLEQNCEVIKSAEHYANIELREGDVVYCDAPYIGTAGYAHAGSFDFDAYFEFLNSLTKRGIAWFVSEYTQPKADCALLREIKKRKLMSKEIRGGADNMLTERLYTNNHGLFLLKRKKQLSLFDFM